MTGTGSLRLRSLWAEAWEPLDPQTRDYAREGELLTARVRIVIVAVILLFIPLKSVLVNPADTDSWIGLGVASAGLLLALGVLALARRPSPPGWLGFFSSILDVSLVSAGNVGFLLAGHPLTVTNSQVQYSIFFLALAGTCLRLDARICLVAGLAALLEYGAVVLWSMTSWDLAAPAFANDPYGAFNGDSQVGRLVLLALGTAISMLVVSRTGRYWRESIYDRLTGLPNRGYIEGRLEQAVAAARRTRRPLVLALADLDHFKEVNDRHGHAAGDAVLRHSAAALLHFFRRTDLIARYGGEEFLILFPEAEAAAAAERLEGFRASFAEEPVRISGAPLPVTMSLGMAAFPADGETPADLLARADQRLYAAKEAGRNRLHTE